MRNKKVGKAIGVLIVIAYILFSFYFCRLIGLDADKANHILQAQDILQGNFWLKDWNLTGITFFTTDLLYYELAVLLCGSIRYGTAYVAFGLMMLSVMSLSLFAVLFDKQENRKQRLILFCCLFAIPCMNYGSALRTHSGAIFWSIIAIMIVANILKDETSKGFDKRSIVNYVFLFLSLLLGITGDMLAAVEGAIPILLFCIITILNDPDKYRMKLDKRTYLIVSSFAAIVGAVAIDKLYFSIGGANKNSYIGYVQFGSVSEWHDRIWSFISNLLLMSDAGFMNGRLNDIWSYTKIINASVIAIGVVLIICTLWDLIRGRNVDVISAILSISFMLIACAHIFTDKDSFKYMTIEPAICYIVLLRRYDTIVDFMKNRRLWIGLIYLLAVISFTGKVEAIMHYNYPEEVTIYKQLAAFLNDHNLHYGYSSFWNSSVFSVISNNNVNIRHIKMDAKNRFTMYNWFNNNQWYLEDTNFILVENTNNDKGSSDRFGLSEDNVIAYFGNPKERYEYSGYIIMVYDHDLSKYLVGVEDGRIIPFEMFCNEKVDIVGEGIDKQYNLHKGGAVTGPCVNVIPGKYSLEFEGEKLDKVWVDVYSELGEDKGNSIYQNRTDDRVRYNTKLNDNDHGYSAGKNIFYQMISQSNDNIVVEFEIVDKNVEDIEFRVFCDEDVTVRLDQILIRKVK